MTEPSTNPTVGVVKIDDAEARALAEAIQQAARTLPEPEARQLVERALNRAPDHPMVLNSAGGFMQRCGDAARARELYTRATTLDPRAPVLRLNLATACRATGDVAAEGQALDEALALEPRYVHALLQKGDLMERLHRPKAAVQLFEAALACIGPSDVIPSSVAHAVAHARQVVAGSMRELELVLSRQLETIRQRHGYTDQPRADAYRDILLGKRRAFSSLPKDTYFPYLPAIEFFPRDEFPWFEKLEAACESIASEATAVLQSDPGEFHPYVDFPDGVPLDQWAPLQRSPSWTTYSLWQDGAPVAEHLARCPATAGALERIPMCDVPGYAPGAYFSVLRPHTRLPAHMGTTNTRCIAHLPLIVPENCGFRVGSQTRTWERGKAWVFDDTIEHEAWNESDQLRIILIFDIWNPLLTEAERDIVRALTVTRSEFYGSDAPVMASR
jgi:aspartate beta-hydroxylase